MGNFAKYKGVSLGQVSQKLNNIYNGQVDTEPETIKVTGSKGAIYNLTRVDNQWQCSCPGYLYRGACKHLELTK